MPFITKIECKKCGDIKESKHRHDYAECTCGLVAIDGGKDYIRISGNAGDYVLHSYEVDEIGKEISHKIVEGVDYASG